MRMIVCIAWFVLASVVMGAESEKTSEAEKKKDYQKVQAVIDQVEKACIDRTVYMIGRKKAERLAELVREAKPRKVLECGTAIGYSGLWIARELKAAGNGGKLISIEIDPKRAEEARKNFRNAGLEKFVTVKVGDAREVVKQVDGPIDLAFIDCGYSNYLPILKAIEDKLRPGATVVADNVGIGSGGLTGYMEYVRSKYKTRTEWFEIELPWAKRDAMEITAIPKE
jgi:predicted O-methyltransferase YrrM